MTKRGFLSEDSRENPSGEVEIDWDNDITRGLQWFISGNNPARDLTGRSAAMTYETNATHGVNAHGMAMRFDGSGDNIIFASPYDLSDTSKTTFGCWFLPNGFATDQELFTDSSGLHLLRVKVTTGLVRFWLHTGSYKQVQSVTALVAGVPAFIVGTYDGANHKIYINGVEDNSTVLAGSLTASGGSWWLGAKSNGSNATDGDVWAAFTYNRALNAAEVYSLYENTNQIVRKKARVLPFAPAATSTMYWGVSTSPTKPTVANLKIGTGMDDFGSVAGPGVGTEEFAVTGLSAATTYYSYFYHENEWTPPVPEDYILESGPWNTLAAAGGSANDIYYKTLLSGSML